MGLYLISSIITGYITFISANYVLQSNELFQKMKQYATIDALTGLGNVRQFDLEMNRHISNKNMKNDSFCLLLIDIDHFKYVNDTYGHPAGDEVLKQVGCILRETSQFPDLAFRKGGEEFALLIPNKGLAYGIRMGEQIRTAVESHPFQLLDGTKIKLQFRWGFQNMKNHRRNLFKRRMMRYTTRNEMVEIRSALYLKDKMTRRHKAYKNTHRGNV